MSFYFESVDNSAHQTADKTADIATKWTTLYSAIKTTDVQALKSAIGSTNQTAFHTPLITAHVSANGKTVNTAQPPAFIAAIKTAHCTASCSSVESAVKAASEQTHFTTKQSAIWTAANQALCPAL